MYYFLARLIHKLCLHIIQHLQRKIQKIILGIIQKLHFFSYRAINYLYKRKILWKSAVLYAMASKFYNEFTTIYKRGAFKEAAGYAERCSLEPGENSGFWLTQQSRALLREGRSKEAHACAQRAVQHTPGNQYALLARADALVKLGRFSEALDDFTELLHSQKTVSRARRGVLECIAQTTKNWSRMLALITEWNLPPEEAFRWRVTALSGLERREDAMKECHNWLRLSPDNPTALWQLTELEIARDGLEQVLTRMARLAKIPSRPPIYGEIYASLCRRAGKTETALSQYKKLAGKSSDPRIIRKQAFALAKSGRETEAIPLMEELLRIDPGDIYIHSSYIAACKRLNDLARPERFYRELLSAHPNEKSLYGRLRKIQAQTGTV